MHRKPKIAGKDFLSEVVKKDEQDLRVYFLSNPAATRSYSSLLIKLKFWGTTAEQGSKSNHGGNRKKGRTPVGSETSSGFS